jgi:hypothetical protein
MTDELKELISKADRGDGAAQKELMTRGDDVSSAGDHEQAAYLYKMAAMAYRIEVSRVGTRASEASGQSSWMDGVQQLYLEWIAAYTKPVAPRINRLNRHEGDFDRPIMSMRREGGKYGFMLRYLERQLMEHDVEICTGAGINRHFYYMVQQREGYKEFMNDVEMRVVLDPLADEVMRRCQSSKRATSL